MNIVENKLAQTILTVEDLLQDALLNGSFNLATLSPAFGNSFNQSSWASLTLDLATEGLKYLS